MPVTYTVKEIYAPTDSSDIKAVILEDGLGGFIHVRARNVADGLCKEDDIVKVIRRMKPEDVYPPVLDSDVVPDATGDLYFKDVRLVKSNPWKFNTVCSVRREIIALSELKHPNIVRLHGVFVENGLVKGLYTDKYDLTLKQVLENGIEFDRIKFFQHLLKALWYIRQSIFVHGALKETCIMVKKEDPSFPYIVNFDACEKAGTMMIETTKTFGEAKSDIISYGCDF
ncbi:hypothetical protein GGF46_004474 [Coemansia sp. RSA 552]|nr:hypothetical protein GGF46_004474 [Coemansia sp. RSA 552]